MLFETDENKPMTYDEARLTYIDNAIDWCGEYGINLILDLHHAPGFFLAMVKRTICSQMQPAVRVFLAIWRMFAIRYRGIGDRLIFELLNELVWDSSDPWNILWREACDIIWRESPMRRIIVGSNRWNSMDELKNLAVIDDERVIYTFHCYEPFWFTHQRAQWIPGMRDYTKPCEYPFRPADHAEYNGGSVDRDYAGYDIVDGGILRIG